MLWRCFHLCFCHHYFCLARVLPVEMRSDESPRLAEVDEFIDQLWKTHLTVKDEGYMHTLSLGMFRSDYMLHVPLDEPSVKTPSVKQVEFNTISSSFGGLACLVTAMHTELCSFPTLFQPVAYPPHPLFGTAAASSPTFKTDSVPPPNHAVETLCAGLAAAHAAYGSSRTVPPLPLCVIFLVQDGERNAFDQLALSAYLFSHHRIPSFRLPCSEILTQTMLAPSNPARPLIYTNPARPDLPHEATVVYFRALYAPSEYNSATSWQARLHLERSAATKCPSVLLHLAGSKKVQQVLTSKPPGPDHLRRFLPHHPQSTLDALRATFAPQYSLSPDPTLEHSDSDTWATGQPEGLKLAFDPSSAERHVLKPQREGGGNNIYRSSIPGFLRGIPEREFKGYILMELIQPPREARNTVLRSDGRVVTGDVVSELGIFGTILWKNEHGSGTDTRTSGTQEDTGLARRADIDILHNTEGGYLLRTKGRENDEGGVAAGFSSLDSLILYDA